MNDTVDRIARLDPTQFGDETAALMRAHFEANKRVPYCDEAADELMLGLFNIAYRAIEAEVIAPLLKERDKLNAECERAWEAYRIAHNLAMANGEALIEARAALQTGGE
jgi:hypothetical protein